VDFQRDLQPGDTFEVYYDYYYTPDGQPARTGNISYAREPLYITAAYERHKKVNRQSDITGIYSSAPPSNYLGPITTNTTGVGYDYWVPTAFSNAGVADEDGGKIGIQNRFFGKKTVVNAVFETMHRYVPGIIEFQNER